MERRLTPVGDGTATATGVSGERSSVTFRWNSRGAMSTSCASLGALLLCFVGAALVCCSNDNLRSVILRSIVFAFMYHSLVFALLLFVVQIWHRLPTCIFFIGVTTVVSLPGKFTLLFSFGSQYIQPGVQVRPKKSIRHNVAGVGLGTEFSLS